MTERVSDRHEGDLGGLLLPFDETRRASLTVVVPSEWAATPAAQHTAWMLVNVLCRMKGIVDAIGLLCPQDVPLHPQIVPFAPTAGWFDEALLQGAAEIGIVPVTPGIAHERRLIVGPAASEQGLRVWGQGWTGGVSSDRLEIGGASMLPFGPYVAASLAAAEVFKAARAPTPAVAVPTMHYLSAWEMRASTSPILTGPPSVEQLVLSTAIAGVGAVGSAVVHALWACPGLTGDCDLIDADPAGIDITNLNRYALFGRSSLGRPKATEASRIAAGVGIRWHPFDVTFAEFAHHHPVRPRVLSAVDINPSRREIQLRYPARIVSASTKDLRAEVTRCGPPGVGACLCCFNPVDMGPTDAELQELVRRLTPEQRATRAAGLGMSTEDVNAFAETGQCGGSSDRLMADLRSGPPLPSFAVSFVAALTGTLAAAELVKDNLAAPGPLNDTDNNVRVQLWNPADNVAYPYGRDVACECCRPSIALDIWSRRFAELEPSRSGTDR